MPLKDFIRNLNIVDPKDVIIGLNWERNTLQLKIGNTVHNDVIPERPFPMSNPKFTILKDSTGSDICTIIDAGKIEGASLENLQKLLDKLYFVPRIVKINKLEASGEKFDWDTVTTQGNRKFSTSGRRSITIVENKMVISDIDDNLYEVDIQSLDAKSKKIIESTF